MIHGEIHSSLDKSQMLGSVIGLQAALQHSPFAFVVCSHVVAFSRLKSERHPRFHDIDGLELAL
jgi:hypothetical protein